MKPIKIVTWKTKMADNAWKTTCIFLPERCAINISKFDKKQYDKYHKEQLGYKCSRVIEITKQM